MTPAVPATSLFETVQGSRLFVSTVGTGPSVLALHGLGGGAYFFEGCAVRLADTCRMVMPDLPGTGASRVSATPTLSSWIADLTDLLRWHASGSTIVIGHSLGTILALELWREAPDLLAGMVFVGGLPKPRRVICERLLQRRSRIAAGRVLSPGLGYEVAEGVLSPQTRRDHPERTASFARLFHAQDVEGYLASLDILVTADAWDVVPTVRVPCLAVSGADDQYAPPDDVAAFVRRLPRETRHIVMPNVGHLPFIEAPEAFADVLRGWMGGTTG